MKSFLQSNPISDIGEANEYLSLKYTTESTLIPVQDKNKQRFKFVNVPPIANFPHSFKSVSSAMNCLAVHENGFIDAKLKAKREMRMLEPKLNTAQI